MVSFQCEGCGDVLTKKKLDTHINRCWNASYSCIDCMTHFQGFDYRKHTSCISEAQKYQGALYKEKKPKSQQNSQSVSKVEAPPRAPSPPSAAYPVNVFDYLVEEKTPVAASVPKDIADGVRYGSGPVERSMERFDSGLYPITEDTGLGYSTSLRTPGGQRGQESGSIVGDKNSEKKRKRGQAEDLSIEPPQTAPSLATQPSLHSGLTGGLNRLLSSQDPHDHEASPLSPKKRSKSSLEEKSRKRKDDDGRHSKNGDDEDRRHKKHRQQQSEAGSRSGREVKSIEYPAAQKQADESNSEFFLSLVNKDHLSSKGQSIWGALKMFREGLPGDMSSKEVREHEEKKLFRGLRMKLNDAGEIVLFSRPDLENLGSSGMELIKR